MEVLVWAKELTKKNKNSDCDIWSAGAMHPLLTSSTPELCVESIS
ncbi:hypothetical protein BIW11_02503 [Tropilaelaps mercedesae]|uniref:Uncharacterized protein n=1 Tax=Tropilaelaps mercedesae TaxID=418985 RepID=A0A1V9Y1Z7_9ACAR|nr:hypothetical protein BIW11_02503 [Tropilaelaps mercedesae]